jgi:hypothetical protein
MSRLLSAIISFFFISSFISYICSTQVFGALMRPLTLAVLVEEEEEEEPVLKMKLPDGQSVTGFRHLVQIRHQPKSFLKS